MLWGNHMFSGRVPRLPARMLPENAAQVAHNCWLDEMRPRPLPTLTLVGGVPAFRSTVETIYRFDAVNWFQWDEDVDVVPAPVFNDTTNRTIWTGQGGSYPRMTSTAIMGGGFSNPGIPNSRRLGIPAPTQAADVTLGALTDPDVDATGESHTWIYTFVSDLSEEGPPSPASAVLTRGFNMDGTIQQVTIGSLPTAAPLSFGNTGLAVKRIYRSSTGASGRTAFQLLAEIPITQSSFTDSTLTGSLGAGIITTNWDPPAADLKGIIALPNGVLAAFRDREVHFSQPFQPHAWPPDYVKILDAPVVGLDNFGTNVVVGTEGSPALISGTDPARSTPNKLEYNQACVGKGSFSYVDLQGVVYASPDGLVLVGPSGGELVSRDYYERKDWQALSPATMRSVYHDGTYLAFLNDRCIAFDPKGRGVIETDDRARAVFADRERDTIYLVDQADNRLKEWTSAGAGAKRTMRWRCRQHHAHARTFSAAQVNADAYPVTIRFFTDGVQRPDITVENEDPFRLPPLGKHSHWSYEVEGTNAVLEVRVGAMPDMQ